MTTETTTPTEALDTRAQKLIQALATQDNACTSHPVFAVEQRKRFYGFDPAYSDDVTWITSDDCIEAVGDEADELEAEYQRTHREPENWTRTAYQDHWQFVTACLTRAGAEEFIERQRHNLTDPRVYVHSAHRNHEWQLIRKLLPALLAERDTAHARIAALERMTPDELVPHCRFPSSCDIHDSPEVCAAERWLPITSAPEGEDVWLYALEHKCHAYGVGKFERFSDGTSGWIAHTVRTVPAFADGHSWSGVLDRPTHWQPFFAPPTPTQEAGR